MKTATRLWRWGVHRGVTVEIQSKPGEAPELEILSTGSSRSVDEAGPLDVELVDRIIGAWREVREVLAELSDAPDVVTPGPVLQAVPPMPPRRSVLQPSEETPVDINVDDRPPGFFDAARTIQFELPGGDDGNDDR